MELLKTIESLPRVFQLLGGVFGLYVLVQLILLFWFLFFHHLPLIKIRKRLYHIPKEINEEMRGRGLLRDEYDRQVTIQQKPLKEELEMREYNRSKFLDFMRLISIIRFKN